MRRNKRITAVVILLVALMSLSLVLVACTESEPVDAAYEVMHIYERMSGDDEIVKSTETGIVGETVTVESVLKTNYELDTAAAGYKDTGVIAADGSLKLKLYYKLKSFAMTKADATNGTFAITVSDTEATSAKVGQTVVVTPSPALGYAVESVSVATSDAAVVVDETDGYRFEMPLAEVTVTVTFVAKENTVVFDGNGSDGGAAMTSQTFVTDATAALKENTFSRTGYLFAGWSTSANGEKAYDDGHSLTYTANLGADGAYAQTLTLYAVWAPRTDVAYTVEHYYETIDGAYRLDADKTQSLTGTTGETVTAEAYVANAEYLENTEYADRVPSGVIAADGSLVLCLYYNREEYTISSAGDTALYTVGADSAKFGATINFTISETAKNGYSFTVNVTDTETGLIAMTWSGDETEGYSFTLPAYDVTITVEAKFTVTVVDLLSATQAHFSFDYGESVDGIPQPTKDGYTFDGYCADENLTQFVRVETADKNMTVYAKYVAGNVLNSFNSPQKAGVGTESPAFVDTFSWGFNWSFGERITAPTEELYRAKAEIDPAVASGMGEGSLGLLHVIQNTNIGSAVDTNGAAYGYTRSVFMRSDIVPKPPSSYTAIKIRVYVKAVAGLSLQHRLWMKHFDGDRALPTTLADGWHTLTLPRANNENMTRYDVYGADTARTICMGYFINCAELYIDYISYERAEGAVLVDTVTGKESPFGTTFTAVPEAEGYTFDGYYVDNAFSNVLDFSTIGVGDKVFAKFVQGNMLNAFNSAEAAKTGIGQPVLTFAWAPNGGARMDSQSIWKPISELDSTVTSGLRPDSRGLMSVMEDGLLGGMQYPSDIDRSWGRSIWLDTSLAALPQTGYGAVIARVYVKALEGKLVRYGVFNAGDYDSIVANRRYLTDGWHTLIISREESEQMKFGASLGIGHFDNTSELYIDFISCVEDVTVVNTVTDEETPFDHVAPTADGFVFYRYCADAALTTVADLTTIAKGAKIYAEFVKDDLADTPDGVTLINGFNSVAEAKADPADQAYMRTFMNEWWWQDPTLAAASATYAYQSGLMHVIQNGEIHQQKWFDIDGGQFYRHIASAGEQRTVFMQDKLVTLPDVYDTVQIRVYVKAFDGKAVTWDYFSSTQTLSDGWHTLTVTKAQNDAWKGEESLCIGRFKQCLDLWIDWVGYTLAP